MLWKDLLTVPLYVSAVPPTWGTMYAMRVSYIQLATQQSVHGTEEPAGTAVLTVT